MDALSMDETVEMAAGAMRSGATVTHVAINVAKLVRMRTDPTLRMDVTGADIIGVDGMGLVWGARLHGIRIPERVAGIDLMWNLIGECERHGYKPFFLGAKEEVVRAAAQGAIRAFPKLEIAGVRNGYFSSEDEQEIVAHINDSGADCLFVGLPTPMKERFLSKHRSSLKTPFVMGVGGSFDVIGGKVSRAPRWMQQASLEWLYRIMQEPRRLVWRYASTNARFLLLLLSEFPFARDKPIRHEDAR